MVEKEKGCLVISLDFELMWGNIESWTIEGYGKTHVKQVREVITRLLALFEKYQVKATFATVGFIMQQQNEVMIPNRTPSYTNQKLSPYGNYMKRISKENANLYFAPDIIEQLKHSSCVEIGTHTYCHYYCWEKGQSTDQFDADLSIACEVARKNGIDLKSIVFPRNQVSEDYLTICKEHGITSYRGNAKKYFNETKSIIECYKNKVCRFLDTYLNIGGNTSYKLNQESRIIQNIPASRFIRPYSHQFSFLERLRFRRIRKEMEYAARYGEVYHIWWHPHNFGADMKENLAFLEKILKTYQQLHEKYGMSSMTMKELAQ